MYVPCCKIWCCLDLSPPTMHICWFDWFALILRKHSHYVNYFSTIRFLLFLWYPNPVAPTPYLCSLVTQELLELINYSSSGEANEHCQSETSKSLEMFMKIQFCTRAKESFPANHTQDTRVLATFHNSILNCPLP